MRRHALSTSFLHHLKTVSKAENVMSVLYNASNSEGLFSDTWSPEGTPRSSLSP